MSEYFQPIAEVACGTGRAPPLARAGQQDGVVDWNGRLCALTSNQRWADVPGNVALARRSTCLTKDSIANVSQIVTFDRSVLTERVGKLSRPKLDLILTGIDVVLDRS